MCALGGVLIAFPGVLCAETVGVFFNSSTNDQIKFAADDVKAALEARSYTVEFRPLAQLNTNYTNKKVVIGLSSDSALTSELTAQGGTRPGTLGEQAYALRTTTTGGLSYWALGGDPNGAMYGGLQIAENISFNGFSGSYTNEESPFLLNRGMKLNLPLDRRIPTYVGGWSSLSAREAIPHVWEMDFWRTLIDQQARSRYNVLSIWVHHPFPALVRTVDYPNASLPNIQRYDGSTINLDHNQRVAFWREVMQYAHARGMKFYFFNWNIYVDYASTQYPALTRDATNPTTIDYYYKSMQALLGTYPELDGFGITSGDGMDGTLEENTQWTWDAMGKAVYDYLINNPARQFNLIHRGVKTDPETCDSIYAPIKSVTNATFNMSAKYAMAHMYSTPAPRWTGDIQSCANLGLKTWLTFRNDDFFYLNWGDPQFVRDFMTGIPLTNSVVGMYIGIDGYNPSRARLYAPNYSSLNGQLEVKRRWYMEMLWGRISYNPGISDEVFKDLLAKRYPALPATNLFIAWTLASRSLPKVTELIMKDWSLDFHWYPEGCWSDPGRCTGFRTISDVPGDIGGFAGQDVANGSALCNIANSAAGTCGGKKSSYQVADEMQVDAANALALINTLSSGGNADLEVAINNVKQLAYLSRYYAHKIRGATYKKAGNTLMAREEMGQAYCWWISYSRSMESTYLPDSFRSVSIAPDWKYADAAVLKEYTDLGGVGVPVCDNYFTLTTSATNGAISLNPAGGIYATNTVVTVTATPNYGYAFGNWSGALSGSVSRTNLTMNGPKSVTAHFVVSTNGDVAPWIENFTMADGTKQHGAPTSWTAARSSGKFEVAGNRFMINGGSGTTSVEGILETAAINIPGGSVKVSLDVQSQGVDSSDYVRFYKVVDGGSSVLINQGIITGTTTFAGTNISGSKLKLRIIARVSASDEFYFLDNLKVEYEAPPIMFTLTTSATNGVVNPVGGSYASNSTVRLTATANLGYVFSSWSGDLTGSVNPTNLTMNGNKSVTANFVPVPTYTLTPSATNGSITLNPPPIGGFYNAGTVVTVTATPSNGYAFSHWSGDLSGSANPTSLTLNTSKSVTANFSVLPPGNMNVLLVVSSSGASASDLAISNRLKSSGYTVQVLSASLLPGDTALTNASNKGLILISSTISSGDLVAWARKFMTNNLTVPVINWEGGNADEWGFSASAGSANATQTLLITNAPNGMTAGLTNGTCTIYTAVGNDGQQFTGPTPGLIVAAVNPTTGSARIAGMPVGVVITNFSGLGVTATNASRKVFLGLLGNNQAENLYSNGLALFDAAVSWAIGQAAAPPSWVQPPVLQGGQLRLEWVGGTLQTTTNVAGPWSDVSDAISPHLQPTTNPAQFFRVKQ